MKVEIKRTVKKNFKITKKIEQSIIYFANNDITKVYRTYDQATSDNKLDIIHIVDTLEQKLELTLRADDYVKKNSLQYFLNNSSYLKEIILSYDSEELKVDGLIYFARRLKEDEKLEIIKSLKDEEDILNCQSLLPDLTDKLEVYNMVTQTYIKNRFIKNVKDDHFTAAALLHLREGELQAEDFAIIESDDIKIELALYTDDDYIKYDVLSKLTDRRCVEIVVIAIEEEELREKAMIEYLYDETSQVNTITTFSDNKKMMYLAKGYSSLNKATIIRSMDSRYNREEALQYLVDNDDKDFYLSSLLSELPDKIKEREIHNLTEESHIASLLLSFENIENANKYFHLIKDSKLIVYVMKVLYERYGEEGCEIDCNLVGDDQVLFVRLKGIE